MTSDKSGYPDISDILQRKLEGRRDIAARSFAEKIEMLEQMRERISALKVERDNRALHK